jgi:hypothetical protein
MSWLTLLAVFSAWISWGAIVFLFTFGRDVHERPEYVLGVFWKILLFLAAGQTSLAATVFVLAKQLGRAQATNVNTGEEGADQVARPSLR